MGHRSAHGILSFPNVMTVARPTTVRTPGDSTGHSTAGDAGSRRSLGSRECARTYTASHALCQSDSSNR